MPSDEGHPRPAARGRPVRGRITRLAAVLAVVSIGATAIAGSAQAPADQPPGEYAPQGEYAPGEVIVKYAEGTAPSAWTATAKAAGADDPTVVARHTRLLRLASGVSVQAALTALHGQRDVVWATPDYKAHAAGVFIPNDPGPATPGDVPGGAPEGAPEGAPGGWEQLQWNFSGTFGVEAPEAWANVGKDSAIGGRGVIVAVLDTGVAYANRGRYRRSPDFGKYQFVEGYDFVNHSPYPNDLNGHGTFVAGTIAEETNNGFGLTGLAYGARIMPVRVLNGEGEGYASTIAEGVMFAVRHGAKVINLSLEFSSDVTAGDIPGLIDALRYAYSHRVVVVAAAGNEGHEAIAYPARGPHVIAVGATTEHGCLADYSNYGPGLALVAPGGGADASLPGDPYCRPELPSGKDVFQMTFTGSSPSRFGFPNGYEGTSMAAPHVAATAALIIASGVLGRKPTPAQITARLKATARKLGGPDDSDLYGAGLVDAAAATAPGGPGAVR
jgi:serine protease